MPSPITAPRRGRPRSLTRTSVADAALRVLDREGFQGLSLRAVARELGVNPSTLYTYASGVEELLTILAEALADQVSPPRRDLPPRQALAGYFRRLADQGARHPRLLEIVGLPSGSADGLRHVEGCLEHLMALGLTNDQSRIIYALLLRHAIGVTVSRTAAERFETSDVQLAAGHAEDLPIVHSLVTEGLPTPERAYEQEVAAILDVLVPALAGTSQLVV